MYFILQVGVEFLSKNSILIRIHIEYQMTHVVDQALGPVMREYICVSMFICLRILIGFM